jgi:diadenosine tetraphosphate (Ap4A) HIT family hydrolase
MLSEEEAEEIKQKLISHIESNFPEEQIANAKQQVESMNSEQLENFLDRNKLIKEQNPENQEKSEREECVFCSIDSDKIKSIKINENIDAIAVLEINPISKGHSIIIPRKHVNKVSKSALNLAEKVSKKIKEKFSPKSVEISTSKLFGHEILNVLPVYNKENFNSERKPTRIEELEKIKEELGKKKEVIKKKSKIEEIKDFWLPKRIP